MQLGMIGLGRMGANMVQRLLKAGHDLHVFDTHQSAMDPLIALGATGASDLAAVIAGRAKPRAVWLMLPAAAVDGVLATLVPLLDGGDIVRRISS